MGEATPKTFVTKWSSSDTSKDFKVHNPATGAVIATVRAGDKSTAGKAVEAAQTAFESWSKQTIAARAQLLVKCAAVLEEHKQELAELLCSENGKPVADALLFDVNFVVNIFRYFASLVDKLPGEFYDSGPVYRTVVREPHGVCVGILPFNWPPIHTGGKAAPCLAMGNTMVLKPGEQAPLTCMRIVDLVNEVLPEGVLSYVPGWGPEVPQALTEHKLVRMISLTGSTAAGAAMAKTASALVKPTVLELGGKNAFVVFADANVDRAVRDAIEGAFFNKGEACTAASRLLVHKDIHDAFVSKFSAAVKRVQAGNGTEKGTHVGPCVTQAQKDRVLEYIRIGKEEGATVEAEGLMPTGEDTKNGYFVPPTLFTSVKRTMRIAQEEMFGPVVTVTSFSTEDEAVSIVNEARYGLVTGIYSRDMELAMRVSRNIQSGLVFINNYFRNVLGVPFGGVKETGYGREHCIDTLKDWSTAKVIQFPSGMGTIPSWRAVADVLENL